MRHLCDGNFWVALSRGSHEHHRAASGWLDGLTEGDTLVFCRATQQALLRLLTNVQVTRQTPLSNRQALACYSELRRDSRIEWQEEPAGLEEKWFAYANRPTASPKVWMDAYLAAFAFLIGARLVTFDQGFRSYRGLDWIDPSRLK